MAAAGFRAAALALTCAACTSIAADARTFEGTRWRVTAINGRATPASGDYRIEFTRKEIGGRFGCNVFGGRFAIVGELMSAGEVRSTLMGCSEPAATFETGGLAVLNRPMHMHWNSGRQLTLSNSGGSIELERAR